MTTYDKASFNKAESCFICEQPFTNTNIKVRDHCHFTGKYRGAAHSKCNLNYKTPNYIPIFFHNLKNYDAHLFIKHLAMNQEQIKVIPQSFERYVSFTKLVPVDKYISQEGKQKTVFLQMRFIDSYKFLSSKLETLASFLSAEQCRTVRKVFPEDERFSYMRCKDVSKTVIYDFFYNFLKHQYSNKVSLAYTDTDSLIVHVETDNFYEEMKSHMHYFDTSNYDADNPHNMPQTASELGKMKDEYGGKVLSAFYGTGPKAYCIDAVDQVAKRAKGISKASVKHQLHLLHYKDIVEEKRTSVYCTIYVFKSESHNIYTNYIRKVALTSMDDKRFLILIPNSTKTLAWGHQDITFHKMSDEERLDLLLRLMNEASELTSDQMK
ncbi:unnamed protein product [Acanthoscelides obtectus]|uniref:DNA-directed DNA polymerase n=1 Tax=Acanthoscelides obtectus TaxID=200917 RepID=A0A9P0KXA3_ACAOB|nr:unnamed protein product [Acanthoscelides obtectus]CAK1672053.1 hypothetical protein AOBTE_LOCUS28625 [Acanthoscelides obtectus]